MISSLVGEQFAYVRPSLVAWGLLQSTHCQSIDDLVASTIARLASDAHEFPLVVDCRDIVRIGDHAFDAIVDPSSGKKAADAIQEAKRSLLFWLPEDLDHEFESALGRPVAAYAEKNGQLSLYGKWLEKGDAVDKLAKAQALLGENVHAWVKECFQPWEVLRRLPSTPLRANGYFDSRAIIGSPEKFKWTCVALRDALSSGLLGGIGLHGEDSRRSVFRSVGLMAVSLRASAFAAGVATLLGEDFIRTLSIVDHAGPRKRIFDRSVLEGWPEGCDFILISDFIVGGSELRAAEILTEFRGGQLIGAVCLGSALPPEEYNTSCKIHALTHLRSCVPQFEAMF